MPNLRILYDNVLDRATSLTASTTSGSLVAANLLNDFKGQVWRSTGNSATLTIVLPAVETIGAIALAFTNLSAVATMRVQLYSDTGATTQILDSGTNACCGAPIFGVYGFAPLVPAGVPSYSYGGGSYAGAWVPPTANVRAIKITLSDSSLSFIEAARLIAGNYWSPAVNADVGAALTMVDASTHARSDAGDLLTQRGSRHKKITLNLSWLSTADQASLVTILRTNGMARALFLSVFPANANAALDQAYQVWGRLSQVSSLVITDHNLYAAPIDIEEV